MQKLINKNILKIKSYNPPIEGRRSYAGLLLDFNERTTPYSEIVKNAMLSLGKENKLQYYPEYNNTTELVAKYVGVDSKNILITNGADQGIDLVFRTFTSNKDKVIIPSPSFAMFYQCAKLADNNIVTPKYNSKTGQFPLEEVLSSITTDTKLIIICNPNNPTGTLINLDKIEQILKKTSGMVMVDEAYIEYTSYSAVKLIVKYKNLIVVRTFSKAFGLAALRIGYVVANKKIIEQLNKVRGPYDINMAAIFAVRSVLNNLSPLKNYISEIMNEAKPLLENFLKKQKIKYYPSGANFILFKPKNADIIFEFLKKQKILLRPRNGFGFDSTLRLSLGTIKQTKAFIEIYKKICIKNK